MQYSLHWCSSIHRVPQRNCSTHCTEERSTVAGHPCGKGLSYNLITSSDTQFGDWALFGQQKYCPFGHCMVCVEECTVGVYTWHCDCIFYWLNNGFSFRWKESYFAHTNNRTGKYTTTFYPTIFHLSYWQKLVAIDRIIHIIVYILC